MGNIFSFSCSYGDALLSRCLDCCVGKVAYINELQDNVTALHRKLDEVIAQRKSVERRINLAIQQRKEATEPVKLWLSKVQAVESEVAELKNVESQEIEKLCLGGYCSRNCKSSYKFGKRVADKLKEVTSLKTAGDFEEVAQEIPEDPFDEIPMDPNIVGQESMFDNVWNCLKEKEFRIVGLYGPGGVGKTTLLKQIHNRFCHEKHHFDVVIWTVVSKDPKNVQEDIGKQIGSCENSWSRKNSEEKRQDICKILKKKKFVLLLDDIWERIDLFDLGVPLSKQSKVVFTTRSADVCGQMAADSEFKVCCLEDKDAWDLFQKSVGSDILKSHPEIPKLAEQVAKECCGLPLALKTIGRAMARKEKVEEWEDAVEVLKKSAYEFPGMEEDVYPRLKFSYDSLANQKIRSCFLYCCLFPEDYRIDQKYLIECWLAEGLLGEYDGKNAINRGYTVIGDLVRACLLEAEDDNVVMHDVLRDMALWIACEVDKERENFLVYAGLGINKAPEIEKWEGVKRISLMQNKIENLLDNPKCPDLRTLFLGSNQFRTITIWSEFFQFMPSLRVLNLSHNRLLRALPSGISNLGSLEHLDLSYTGLVTLPEEMKELKTLKYLSVEDTSGLCLFPRQILSNLLMLRTLIMEQCGRYTEQKKDSILFDDCEPLIEELLDLEHLNTLSLTLQNIRSLQKISSCHKVQSCCVRLFLWRISDSQSFNFSSLVDMKHIRSLFIFSCLFKELEIDCVGNLQQFHGFNSLNELTVWECHNLKDMTCLILAPSLKKIYISRCEEMEEIINMEKLVKIQEMLGKDHQIIPFQKLEYLDLSFLYKLQSIYWSALPFDCLNKIEVIRCPKLTKLPLDSNSAKEGQIVIRGEEDWWRNLQWEDEDTQKKFDSCF